MTKVSTSHTFIQVHDGDRVTRVPIRSGTVVIGRAAEAHVRLEARDVSRRHAEMRRDSFGAWWIRDLDSFNGVVVNGQKVKEKQLRVGDEIRIGDEFRLLLCSDQALPPPPPRAEIPAPSHLMPLADLPAPTIPVAHAQTLLAMGRRLMEVPSPEDRVKSLCHTLRKCFPDATSMVLRSLPGGQGEAQRLFVSQSSRFWFAPEDYIGDEMLDSVRRSAGTVLARSVKSLASDPGKQGTEMAAVASPLEGEGPGASQDFLYLVLPSAQGTAECAAVADLAAQQYRLAQQHWRATLRSAVDSVAREAAAIQQAMVPGPWQGEGMRCFAELRPCPAAGGNYIDAFQLRDGRALVVLGDVLAVGLPGSVRLMRLRSVLRALADSHRDLAPLAGEAYAQMRDAEAVPAPRLLLMALDPRTGDLRTLSAGYPAPSILGAYGALREVGGAFLPPLTGPVPAPPPGTGPAPALPGTVSAAAAAVAAMPATAPMQLLPGLGALAGAPWTEARDVLAPDELLTAFNPALKHAGGPLFGVDGVARRLAAIYRSCRVVGQVAERVTATFNAAFAESSPAEDLALVLVNRSHGS